MSIWKWDPFEEFLSQAPLQVSENEFGLGSDVSLTLKRDSEYKLELSASGPPRHSGIEQKLPLGTIYRNNSEILLKSCLGEICLHGVHHTQSKLNISHQSTTTDTFSIEKILFTADSPSLSEYTIEHIGNLPNRYIWPDNNDFSSRTEKILKFGSLPEFNISTSTTKNSCSYNCLHLKINDEDVIIGKVTNAPNVKNAGFIFYRGHPPEQLRRLVRDGLSLVFGTPLIYFGFTSFTLRGAIISLEAVTPYTMGGRAWHLAGLPPAPITTSNGKTNQLDKTLVQRMMQGFVSHSEKYSIAQIPWRLWHAEAAAYFMKPAYYGALIEGIQKEYFEDAETSINRSIISKSAFKRHRKFIQKYLEKVCSSGPELKLFTDKLNSSNIAPQKILASRFFSHLGLSLGSLETEAWNKRNDAAHGNNIAEDDVIQHMRDTKILRIILNRILLHLTNGSDFYFDGYTIGHAVRQLSDPIPQDETAD